MYVVCSMYVVYVVNGGSKRVMTEPVRGTREQQNEAPSPNLKSFSWSPRTRLGFKKHSLSFVCPCSVFSPHLECILASQVVTEHMKFGLQPTWDLSLPWLMLRVHLEPVSVCLKTQVRGWRRRQVLLSSSLVCKGCQAFPHRMSLVWTRVFSSARTPAACFYY